MSEFSNNLAVIVGIGAYGHGVPALDTPVADAEALASLLEDQFGYQVRLLRDREATAGDLKRCLGQELPARLDAGSRLLFYFAGHGVALESADRDGPQGFLLPQDASRDVASFIPMADVHGALEQLPCRHLLVILDCCFAGAFRWAATRDLVPPQLSLYEERYLHFVRHTAWQVLTSAAHDQRALDVPGGRPIGERGAEGSHSPFAARLLEGLAGAADQFPPGGDGVITASELYAYLQNTLESSQTPRCWPLPRHGVGEFVFRDPRQRLGLPRAEAEIELDETLNPYRGLESYGSRHAGLFFGRSELTEALARQVAVSPLAAVVGPSGSGKSSLVRAGLLPRLEDAAARRWTVAPPLRPGEDPLAAFHQALGAGERPVLPGLEAGALRRQSRYLAAELRRWLDERPAEEHLLLVVDQLEELRTQARRELESERFLEQLQGALDLGSERIHWVVTVRSDFEPPFAEHPRLQEWWSAGRFPIRPMTHGELRRVIEKPAEARVLFFDSRATVEGLVDEVVQMPGGLPLLSFTLSEMYRHYLWSGRGDRTLSAGEVRAVGGVIGSLRRRAEEEWQAVPEAQATLRRVMLRMVGLQGGEATRRRVGRQELEYPESAENRRVGSVLRRLEKARLVVADRSPDGEPFVEPAHDSLIHNWDRLRRWLGEEGEILPLARRVTQAADDWQAAGRDRRPLFSRDPRLLQVRSLSKSGRLYLNRRESDFVNRSWKARRRRRLGLASAAAGALTAAILVAVFFFHQSQVNRRLGLSALIRGLTNQVASASADGDHPLALLLARQAYGFQVQAREQNVPKPFEQFMVVFRRVLNLRSDPVADNTARVDTALRRVTESYRPRESVAGHDSDYVAPLRFAPDRDVLAVGSGMDILLHDLADDSQDPRILSAGTDVVTALAFSDDGALLAAGHDDGSLAVWDRATGARAAFAGDDQNAGGSPLDLAWWIGADSAPRLATVSDSEEGGSRVRVWRLDRGTRQLEPTSPRPLEVAESLAALAVAPDGSGLLAGGEAVGLFHWTWAELSRPAGPAPDEPEDEDEVVAGADLEDLSQEEIVAFLDGLTEAELTDLVEQGDSGLEIDEIYEWLDDDDALDLEQLVVVPSTPSLVIGRSLYGETWIWRDLEVPPDPLSPDSTIEALAAVGATGRLVVADDGGILSWLDLEDPSTPITRVATGCSGSVEDLAVNRDGRLLVAGCDGQLLLWRLDDAGMPEESAIRRTQPAPGPGIQTAAFHPVDSSRLAVGEIDGSVHLLDTEARAYRQLTGPWAGELSEATQLSPGRKAVSLLRWSPDGGVVVSASLEGEVLVHEPERGGGAAPGPGPIGGQPCGLAVSAGGRWLAALSGHDDGTMKLAVARQGAAGWTHLATSRPSIKICRGDVAFHPREDVLVEGRGLNLHFWRVDEAGAGWSRRDVAGVDGEVGAVAVSAGGEWLAIGGRRGTEGSYVELRSWEVPGVAARWTVFGDTLSELAFSPDGRYFAAGSTGGQLRLWEVEARDRGPVILGEEDEFFSEPAFSAGGEVAVVSGDTGGLIFLEPRVEVLAATACDATAGNLSWEDWSQFVGADVAYERTCPWVPAHPTVLEAADRRARTGDRPGAVRLYRRLRLLQPELELQPEPRAIAFERFATAEVLDPGQPAELDLALEAFEVIAALGQLEALGLEAIRPLEDLCLWAGLHQRARRTLVFCDRVIEELPRDPQARLARGLARALAGRASAAVKDLEVAAREAYDEEQGAEYRSWAATLRAGGDPFSDEVLAGLRQAAESRRQAVLRP